MHARTRRRLVVVFSVFPITPNAITLIANAFEQMTDGVLCVIEMNDEIVEKIQRRRRRLNAEYILIVFVLAASNSQGVSR